MIWTQLSALIVIDMTIVGLALLMLGVGVSRGMFKKGALPHGGRLMIAAGIVITGLYYLVDLLAITALPLWVEPATQLAVVDFLQLRLRVVATLVSFALIVVGFIVVAVQRSVLEETLERKDRQMRQAEATIIESEGRFRSLIEQYNDAVYCFEFRPPMDIRLPVKEQLRRSHEAILVDCNNEFAKSMDLERPSQIIGLRFGDMDSAKDIESHNRFFTAFIESGYSLNGYELVYRTPNGDDRALSVRFRGVIQDGKLQAAWGAEKSILDFKQAEAALEGREHYQETLATISSRLLTTPNERMDDAILSSLRDVCRYVEADRATLVWFDEETASVQVLYFWSEHGGPPKERFSRASFAWMYPLIESGETIAFAKVDELPESAAADKAALKAMGIMSAAVVPLIVEGKPVGACSITNVVSERDWSTRDLKDLRVLAELFGNSISGLRARKRLDQALAELERAKDRLEAENVYLQEDILSTHGFHELVGESSDLKHCLRQVAQVAATRTPVLIQGETGTGKELIARAIHERSERSDRPLVKINCAALPASLIESELFGHEKGAFTGALSRKRGRFDLADGGTLFLDEIGDFPFDLQGKLLRVLQDGEFQRLGGTDTIRVDARIIAATNRRLADAVDRGEFRADLFYRINTFTIELPPLRDRYGDIPLLAQHFINLHAKQLGKDVGAISKDMLAELESYRWPGNVRELEGVIQRTLITTNGGLLQLDEPLDRDSRLAATGTLGEPRAQSVDLRTAEKDHIEAVLELTGWKIAGETGAAKRLGLPPSTLRSRMKKLGIERRITA